VLKFVKEIPRMLYLIIDSIIHGLDKGEKLARTYFLGPYFIGMRFEHGIHTNENPFLRLAFIN